MSNVAPPTCAKLEPGARAACYDDLAYNAIRDLIHQEHAAVWHEVEAKLAEHHQPGAPRGINPHHLTNGRRRLIAEGLIKEVADTTYGNRVVSVLVPCDQRGRRDAIRTAMRHKRALEGRYLSWSQESERHPNLIGDGGERVVHASLRQTVAGYGLINPDRGEVDFLFDANVPGGPLDNAAHIALDAGDHLVAVTVLVEVKNLRGWIYPNTDGLYQLLYKAAALQAANPRRCLLPVLVARRVHYLAFRMAKHLGFHLIQFDAGVQPILPHWTVKEEDVHEIRDELGYVLMLTDQAMPGVRAQFDRTIPKVGVAASRRWAQVAPALVPHFGLLRQTTLSAPERHAELDRLYVDAASIIRPGPTEVWRTVDPV